jgi:hypothetical protein
MKEDLSWTAVFERFRRASTGSSPSLTPLVSDIKEPF